MKLQPLQQTPITLLQKHKYSQFYTKKNNNTQNNLINISQQDYKLQTPSKKSKKEE
jgi:hypothetical protein